MNRSLLIIIAFQVLLGGCRSPRGEAEKSEQSEADSTQYVQELEYLLPSPAEFFSVIDEIGLEYNSQLIRPIESITSFLLYRNQALNFGVYLTDFSYLLLFDKQSEAIIYLYQIQEMAQLLDIESYFDDEFFNKLLASLNEPDTIRSISIEQSAAFFNRMDAIGNKDLVILISSGSILETMYIALNAVDERMITDNTITTIIDLAYIFDSFYLNYITTQPKGDEITPLSEDLLELRKIFNSMAISQVSKAIRKDGNLVLTSEVTHEVNEYNVRKMKVMVNTIREKIVNQAY
ncbi:MAG: hypothetical protein RBR30_03820 [Tenuifilaceae bacterium]|nr:hypothetical protein [Tenuifilaceae bacterium]